MSGDGAAAIEVTVIRVYLHERDPRVHEVLDYLHDRARVRGLTAYRGVKGFGADRRERTGVLSDLSLDLPLIVEVVEDPERSAGVIEHLQTLVEPSHVVWWSARAGGTRPGS